jgi:hypothetical protein
MLLMTFALVAAAIYVEVRLINALPWLGRLLTRHRDLALFFSIGLSVLLGGLFGAAGVLVFAGGILSSVLVQPYYAARRNGQLDRLRKAYDGRRSETRAALDKHRETISHRVQQGVALVRLVAAILVLPFKLVGWAVDLIESIVATMSKG